MEDKRMQEKHLGKIWREMLVLERVESIHTPLRLEIGEQQAQKWCTGGQTPSSSTGCRFCAVEKEGRERATQEVLISISGIPKDQAQWQLFSFLPYHFICVYLECVVCLQKSFTIYQSR
ncbi:hypothetical protein EJB05_13359, partial [Eragrostis curvula]